MNKKIQFRASPDDEARISALAARRRESVSAVLRKALDIGLESLETGRKIDIARVVTMIEMAAAMADIAAHAVDRERAIKGPQIVMSNLEKFHALD